MRNIGIFNTEISDGAVIRCKKTANVTPKPGDRFSVAFKYTVKFARSHPFSKRTAVLGYSARIDGQIVHQNGITVTVSCGKVTCKPEQVADVRDLINRVRVPVPVNVVLICRHFCRLIMRIVGSAKARRVPKVSLRILVHGGVVGINHRAVSLAGECLVGARLAEQLRSALHRRAVIDVLSPALTQQIGDLARGKLCRGLGFSHAVCRVSVKANVRFCIQIITIFNITRS